MKYKITKPHNDYSEIHKIDKKMQEDDEKVTENEKYK